MTIISKEEIINNPTFRNFFKNVRLGNMLGYRDLARMSGINESLVEAYEIGELSFPYFYIEKIMGVIGVHDWKNIYDHDPKLEDPSWRLKAGFCEQLAFEKDLEKLTNLDFQRIRRENMKKEEQDGNHCL